MARLLAMLLALYAHDAIAKKPDMIFFVSDDHGIEDCSPYRAGSIETPAMQRLRDEGLLFRNAYVASPACGPSRACLLSGLMPARTGAIYNHQPARTSVRSLVNKLTELGYETAGVGKVSHRYGGMERWGIKRVGRRVKSTYPTESVEAFLRDRDKQRPLCLFVGSTATHVLWPEERAMADAEVALLSKQLDTPATREQRNHYLQSVRVADDHLRQTLALAEAHLADDRITIYTSDHGAQWPFAKWNLYESGVRTPLLISWPGVIEPGRETDAMVSWIDLLPTLIELAGGRVPDGLDGRSFADVVRGESDACREAIFTTHNGDGDKNHYPIRAVRVGSMKYLRNLRPEWAFTTHIDQVSGRAGEAYLTTWIEEAKDDPDAAALVDSYYRRPAEELYDLADDPDETINRIEDPAYAESLAELRNRLDDWMAEQGDDGLIDPERRVRRLAVPSDWAPDWSPLSTNPPPKKRKGVKSGVIKRP